MKHWRLAKIRIFFVFTNWNIFENSNLIFNLQPKDKLGIELDQTVFLTKHAISLI